MYWINGQIIYEQPNVKYFFHRYKKNILNLNLLCHIFLPRISACKYFQSVRTCFIPPKRNCFLFFLTFTFFVVRLRRTTRHDRFQ